MRSRKFWSGIPVRCFLILLFCTLHGCSFGPNSPSVQNAMDMLRIERDAAEDEYYILKQKHDEALWKIEDLENQIDSIQKQPTAEDVSYESLREIDDLDQAYQNSYTPDRESFDSDAENIENQSTINSRVATASGQKDIFREAEPRENSEPIAEGDSDVSNIKIDSQMTRGFDSHGKSGDDGILVAIQPMDHLGQFVPVAAPITISLIDPARNGIRQRVGLWKFTSEQVASRVDFDNQVFLFRLPWQRQAPIHSDLKLYVRFQSNGGKRETEMDFHAVLDDAPRSRWTEIKPPTDSVTLPPPGSLAIPADSTTEVGHSKNSAPPVRIARPEWSPVR